MGYKISTADLSEIRLNETDSVASVIQNISIILNTWQGSVPLYREFGVSREPMHKPAQVAESLYYAELYEVIEEFEPRVEVLDVTFESDSEGKLIPIVEVEFIDEQEY